MPPRGGQPRDTTRRPQSTSFNTCPHAGGNDLQRQRRPDRGVSIHAPTRGATSRPVSYHTGGGFQYMPPRGGQPLALFLITQEEVSIHAPTRGATVAPRVHVRQVAGFNTCPHAGGNLRLLPGVVLVILFQYMPPRGGQRGGRYTPDFLAWFQYMPPRGGQPERPFCGVIIRMFQYMPPRGGQQTKYETCCLVC